MRTLVIQSFRRNHVPAWIGRCMASVRAWAGGHGWDYRLTGDEVFALCGEAYLARVGDNMRSITNLARLELIRNAHAEGYERAVWVDADVLVFDPMAFDLAGVARYAFARETWLEWLGSNRWRAFSAVNNSVIVCRAGEADLDFLISATRHVALNRQITSNYQVGGDLIKGLRASLAFQTLGDTAMLSNYVVKAVAAGVAPLIQAQARLHGAPVHAANLCATGAYMPAVTPAQAMLAIERLLETRGGVINDALATGDDEPLAMSAETFFEGPDLAVLEA